MHLLHAFLQKWDNGGESVAVFADKLIDSLIDGSTQGVLVTLKAQAVAGRLQAAKLSDAAQLRALKNAELADALGS